jgi:hypothetical protein
LRQQISVLQSDVNVLHNATRQSEGEAQSEVDNLDIDGIHHSYPVEYEFFATEEEAIEVTIAPIPKPTQTQTEDMPAIEVLDTSRQPESTLDKLVDQEVVEVDEILVNIPGITPEGIAAVTVEVEGAITTTGDNLLRGTQVCKELGLRAYQLSKMSGDDIKAKGFERVKVGKKSKYRKLSSQG